MLLSWSPEVNIGLIICSPLDFLSCAIFLFDDTFFDWLTNSRAPSCLWVFHRPLGVMYLSPDWHQQFFQLNFLKSNNTISQWSKHLVYNHLKVFQINLSMHLLLWQGPGLAALFCHFIFFLLFLLLTALWIMFYEKDQPPLKNNSSS